MADHRRLISGIAAKEVSSFQLQRTVRHPEYHYFSRNEHYGRHIGHYGIRRSQCICTDGILSAVHSLHRYHRHHAPGTPQLESHLRHYPLPASDSLGHECSGLSFDSVILTKGTGANAKRDTHFYKWGRTLFAKSVRPHLLPYC